MLLAIDVGNTDCVIGLYDGKRLAHSWRIHADRSKTADEYGVVLTHLLRHNGVDPSVVAGAVIASVAPRIGPALKTAVQTFFGVGTPVVVDSGVDAGVVLRYNPPEALGADRIANAAGVVDKYDLPAIVVDFGTGTKFDCISAQKEFLGGAIAPGVAIALEALYERAPRLPRIPLEDPGKVIGSSTVKAIQSGVVYGAAGQVDAIVAAIQDEMGRVASVIATGGLSPVIGPHCRSVQVIDPLLTLDGLRAIYARAVNKAAT